MENQEFSGKTVEEASQHALESLGLTEEEVEVTILNRGKAGFLGLGAEEARIRVTPKAQGVEERAKAIVENFLKLMKTPASVRSTSVPQELGPGPKPLCLDIEGGEAAKLIGRKGQTLAAFQYLVNLILSRQAEGQLKVLLDIGEYKQRRYQALRQLALNLAQQVKTTGQPFTMEPLSPLERRIIHLALADDPEINTSSIGQGENRKVVIRKKG